MIFVNINTPRINNARRVKLLNKQVCGDSYIIIILVSDKNFKGHKSGAQSQYLCG